jgi:hypothetical protein
MAAGPDGRCIVAVLRLMALRSGFGQAKRIPDDPLHLMPVTFTFARQHDTAAAVHKGG